MKKNKGFTLIELLVVIAIIGVLASVVLAATNSARSKGGDAAVKSNLANARTQAELFYEASGNKYSIIAAPGVTVNGLLNTTFDVCTPTATGQTVKGINASVLAAAKAAGISSVTLNSTATTTVAVCNTSSTSPTSWAAEVPLKAGGFFCVDSSGKARVNATVGAAGDTSC